MRSHMMICPACTVELSMTERQGVEIDYCSQCRGIWLDRGELEKLIERSTASPYDREDGYGNRPHRQEYRSGHHDTGYQEGHHGGSRERCGGHRRGSFLGDLFDF
jgi:uncharacterized protein